MSMVWVMILASIAGPGGHPVHPAREAGRPVICAASQANRPATARWPSLARRVAHRPCSTPWTSSDDCDEYDTEDVDETWMVVLDALASVPVALIDWARPMSSVEPGSIDTFDSPSASSIPLRC